MQGGKRVYILDEAHMLSAAAWNAFLKTLEEPPSHVVFVLATTEAHKVPATIVDRCHRFDFRRPSLEQIAAVLDRVAKEEGITVPDAAIGMLARAATGSFRDALGTLEQLVTYGGADVKLDDVLDILGVADAELVLDAAESLADHDPKTALLTVKRLSDSGRDITQFMRDLSAHLRHLFVVQTLGEVPDSFSVTADHTERLSAQAGRITQGELLRAIDFLAAGLAATKDGSEPRIQLEMALLKATQPSADLSTQALIHRIEQLESQLAPGPRQPAQAPPPEPAESEPEQPSGGGGNPPRAAAVARGPGGQAATAVAVEEAEPVTALELDRVLALWPAVGETVAEENGMLGAALGAARPVSVEGDRLTVAFPADAAFVKKKAEANRELVQDALRGLTGAGLTVAYELRDGGPGSEPVTLDEADLIERLRSEFAAEEVFEDEE
jgi:DNA polymerase-3 subunit gamma/tau